MAFAIGYKVSKTNELMEKIKTSYEDMKLYITDGWDNVISTLHDHWVGEDEQDFEMKLAERICNLYENAYNLAQGSLDTIEGLAISWNNFQKNNTLDGSTSAGFGGSGLGGFLGIGQAGNSFGIEKPVITHENQVVRAKLITISDDDDRGLQQLNSASAIQEAVGGFVNSVKEKTNNLFNEIQTNEAFFGDQTTTIKNYIEKTGDAIAEVTVALKDMHTALETLAGSSYNRASEDVISQFNDAQSKMDQSLNDLGNSRWS